VKKEKSTRKGPDKLGGEKHYADFSGKKGPELKADFSHFPAQRRRVPGFQRSETRGGKKRLYIFGLPARKKDHWVGRSSCQSTSKRNSRGLEREKVPCEKKQGPQFSKKNRSEGALFAEVSQITPPESMNTTGFKGSKMVIPYPVIAVPEIEGETMDRIESG